MNYLMGFLKRDIEMHAELRVNMKCEYQSLYMACTCSFVYTQHVVTIILSNSTVINVDYFIREYFSYS